MTCPYCGKEVTPGSRFCLYCGTLQKPEYIFKEIPEIPVIPAQPETPIVAAEQEFPVIPKQPVITEQPAASAEQEFPVIPKQPVITERPAAPEPKPVAVKPKPREVNKLRLPTKRSLAKMFFLGILTLGIYPVVIWSRIVTEVNIAASRHDGRRTMPYFAMVLLSPVTLGILPLVWTHNFCCRVGDELDYRRIKYTFGPRTFWLWGVLGSLILVGPFIYTHKLMKAMNLINEDFNCRG